MVMKLKLKLKLKVKLKLKRRRRRIRVSLFKYFLTAYNWTTININLIKLRRETIFRSVIVVDNKRILILRFINVLWYLLRKISLDFAVIAYPVIRLEIFAMHYRMHYCFFVKTLLDRDWINQILSLLSTRKYTKFCWIHALSRKQSQ